jgi:hypothetical protein
MVNRKEFADRLFEVVVLDNGCWEWQGFVNKGGYGAICYRRPGAKGHIKLVHRFFYENLVGPIDEGTHIDHVCHNRDTSCKGGPTCPHRRCANPDHLEAVTPKTNILRGRGLAAANSVKTHCSEGHEFTPENTYVNPEGGRQCKLCRKVAQHKHYDGAGGDKKREYAKLRMREVRKDPEYKLRKSAWERERYARNKAQEKEAV